MAAWSQDQRIHVGAGLWELHHALPYTGPVRRSQQDFILFGLENLWGQALHNPSEQLVPTSDCPHCKKWHLSWTSFQLPFVVPHAVTTYQTAEALSSWEPPLKYQKVSTGPIKVFCSPGWTSLVPSAYDPHAVPGLWEHGTAFKCSLSFTSILTLCLRHQGPHFSSAWGLQCLPNLCHSCACLQPCVWILVLDPVDADPDLGKSLPWVLAAVLLK